MPAAKSSSPTRSAEGTRYDCGSKLGYLKANVEFGLKHPELAGDFREYLGELTGDWKKPEKAEKAKK